jgi:2'-hydroxyisoflavone reductase
MRLLVLGGSTFVGRHMVTSALAGGHEVTTFNRNHTNPSLFPSVERRVGDRSRSELASLQHGEWDAVVDVSGILPRWVRETAHALAGRVGLYAYISTASVYSDLDVDGLDEASPLRSPDDPTSEVLNVQTYGGLKALSEAEVRQVFPRDHLIVRAGTMCGAHDDSDRFTYWVRRLARGTPVLGPSRPDQPVQLLHARDHADFVVGRAATATTGVFNAVGPDQSATFADLLAACAEAADTKPRVVWVPQDFLDVHGIRLPLEIHPADRIDGIYRISNERSRAAGLVNRSLADSAAEVLHWDRRRGQPRLKVARGVSPAREAKLLLALEGGPPAGGRVKRRTPVSPLGLELADASRRGSSEPIVPLMSCLITTTPRTGSWLLADLLAATGLVGQPQEFFRQDFVRTFSRRLGLPTREITEGYLRGIFSSTAADTGTFSVKLQPYDFERLTAALRELPDPSGSAEGQAGTADLVARWLPNPRYVHLSRADTGRQAMSWYRALQSNVWWRYGGDTQEATRPGYPDFLQVRWLENLLLQHEAEWRAYLRDHGIAAYEVVYEKMVEEPEQTVRGVLEFLSVELPPGFVIPPTRLSRMADSHSEVWLRAYEVVRDSLPAKPERWHWSNEVCSFVAPEEGQAISAGLRGPGPVDPG